jgi:hypothetical protein
MRSITAALAVPLGLLLLSPLHPAQDLALARAAARIDTAIPWITDGFYPTDPGRPVAKLPKTGVDREKLLDEALTRAAAEKKPVLWYIPRIEGGHMVRPEFLDAYVRVIAFTDPVLTSFIRARFVPLRMAVDAPISKRTGITKLDWVEPALVVLDERGNVIRRLDRIRTFHRDLFERFFLDALGEKISLPKPAGAGAAKYALALQQLQSGQTSAAETTFHEIVAEFAELEDQWPYAAMAAANLIKGRDTTTIGPAFHGFEDPTPLPAPALAESRPTTACPRPVSDLDDVVKRAVAFLLRRQGENGGFEDSRYAWCDSPRILPNVWVAISAIALAGLHDWRDVDPQAIDAAIARGDAYLFDRENLAPGRNEECYADTFRLVYLRRAKYLAASAPLAGRSLTAELGRTKRRGRDVAGCLIDQQSEAGWLAHEYPNPFATAAGMVAMDGARASGVPVPDAFFERGAKALRSVRGEGGVFAYGARGAPRASDAALKNAMGRMPVCEHALLCASKGEGGTAALEAALDNFWTWLPRLERIRVCDFHSDGELGGFFFWHAMFLTSEAIKALPPDKQAPHHRKMLEHVMRIVEVDGSFVDSHEVGKSYGTGMALMVLRNSAKRAE